MSRWYRAYAGTVKDDKLAEVAVMASCSRSVAIAVWHAILESAAETDDGGRFETTPRRVAAALCEPANVIEQAFAAMAEIGMVEADCVHAWKRRQYESDKSTERSRKHRETKRNADATLQDRCATPPDTETDTETEEDNRAIALSSAEPDVTEAMVEIYHEVGAGIWPKVAKLTPPRKASAKRRLKECRDLEGWRKAMMRARASPFLTGTNKNGWRAGFDFFMQAESFTKLLEGYYDAKHPVGAEQHRPNRASAGIDAALAYRDGFLDLGGRGGERPAYPAQTLDAERHAPGVYGLPAPGFRG